MQNALRKLVRARRAEREKLDGRYQDLSRTPWRRKRQLRARRVMLARGSAGSGPGSGSEQIRQLTGTLVSLRDEGQRQRHAGQGSHRHGHGGDVWVAARLGMFPVTVAKGRQQLLRGDLETGRVR